MVVKVNSEDEMKVLGARLGALFKGGEVIELIGDVGAGKTTLTKGIATGLGINEEEVQSPSFTINRTYSARGDLQLAHYDFYRLHDPGIMASELHETLNDPRIVSVIEWAEVVGGVLPKDRLTISITSPGETARRVLFAAGGKQSRLLLKGMV